MHGIQTVMYKVENSAPLFVLLAKRSLSMNEMYILVCQILNRTLNYNRRYKILIHLKKIKKEILASHENGATTISLTTFSIKTLSITIRNRIHSILTHINVSC
jgi:hypothetical protein